MIRNASLAICVWLSSLAVAGEPEIFAPGVISGPADDGAPTFTPDGKTVYFFRHNGDDYDILESHLRARQWTVPVIAPFSGRWRDLEPAMAPDGSYMIFASSRPPFEGGKAIDGSWNGTNYPGKGGNLWRVDRVGLHWSKPARLPDTVNRSNAVFSPSIAADGTLYYMEASGEGNHWHLFYSALRDGRYQPPQALPFALDAYRDVDPAIAPDQSLIVFSSNRPPSPSGRSDLFIAFRKNGQWGGRSISLRQSIGMAGSTNLGSAQTATRYISRANLLCPLCTPRTTQRHERVWRTWNIGTTARTTFGASTSGRIYSIATDQPHGSFPQGIHI